MRTRIPMLLAALAAAFLTTLAVGEDESAEEAMKAFQKICPALRAGDDGTDAIDVDLRATFMGFDARVSYRRPGHHSFALVDSQDGLPFILVRDGRGLIYDPIVGRLFVTSRAAFRFALFADEQGGMSFRMVPVLLREEPKERDYHLRLDFGSVVGGFAGDLAIRRDEGDRYRLMGRTMRNTKIEIRVDPAKAYPVTGLTCRDEAGVELFEFTKIEKNGNVPMSRFVLPTPERLASALEVSTMPVLESAEDDLKATTILAMSIRGRAAIRNPKARTGLPEEIDWEMIAERDRKHRKALARLVEEAERAVEKGSVSNK